MRRLKLLVADLSLDKASPKIVPLPLFLFGVSLGHGRLHGQMLKTGYARHQEHDYGERGSGQGGLSPGPQDRPPQEGGMSPGDGLTAQPSLQALGELSRGPKKAAFVRSHSARRGRLYLQQGLSGRPTRAVRWTPQSLLSRKRRDRSAE